MPLAYWVLFAGSFDFHPSLFQKSLISDTRAVVCSVLVVKVAVSGWFPLW